MGWDHPRIRGTNHEQSSRGRFQPGSPPHTRDKSIRCLHPLTGGRITPAYAGQITEHEPRQARRWDHPRIRGTNLTSAHSLSPVPGSPPHTRDKFFRLSEGREGERITPAYAGQILKFSIRMMESQDHPRIRGTNSPIADDVSNCSGSPPHTRDKFSLGLAGLGLFRITPAYAGQMILVRIGKKSIQDHPRIRGTNFSNSSTLLYPLGSPPHTRDKCQARRLKARSPRITPAYAGQITCEDVEARYREDHPRIRGTNRTGDQRGATAQGSPPHTRDKYRLNTDSFVSSRITPAYAGLIESRLAIIVDL